MQNLHLLRRAELDQITGNESTELEEGVEEAVVERQAHPRERFAIFNMIEVVNESLGCPEGGAGK